MFAHRNVHDALPYELSTLLTRGATIPSRNGGTLELAPHVITLEHPEERFHTLPNRLANPFAQVAETLWVLAGRNDVEWLKFYLPRAPQFSDDGKVWRAGYGPRLRNWDGVVDQLYEVFGELQANPASRRATAVLYDPVMDTGVETLDIPCNQWLHFLVRDGKLQMNIAVRSNDAIWGWSGINTFEWSVLQELLATSLGVGVGQATYLIGSFHLYDHHLERAQRIVELDSAVRSVYSIGAPHVPVATTLSLFDEQLDVLFDFEAGLRGLDDPFTPDVPHQITDPFLRQSAHLLQLYHIHAGGAPQLTRQLAASQLINDFRLAALEWLDRTPPRSGGSK